MIEAIPIKGRFRDWDEEELEQLYYRQKRVLKSFGALGPDDLGLPVIDDLPLWALVEFQDNVIRFEMQCNPELAGEITQH